MRLDGSLYILTHDSPLAEIFTEAAMNILRKNDNWARSHIELVLGEQKGNYSDDIIYSVNS